MHKIILNQNFTIVLQDIGLEFSILYNLQAIKYMFSTIWELNCRIKYILEIIWEVNGSYEMYVESSLRK